MDAILGPKYRLGNNLFTVTTLMALYGLLLGALDGFARMDDHELWWFEEAVWGFLIFFGPLLILLAAHFFRKDLEYHNLSNWLRGMLGMWAYLKVAFWVGYLHHTDDWPDPWKAFIWLLIGGIFISVLTGAINMLVGMVITFARRQLHRQRAVI